MLAGAALSFFSRFHQPTAATQSLRRERCLFVPFSAKCNSTNRVATTKHLSVCPFSGKPLCRAQLTDRRLRGGTFVLYPARRRARGSADSRCGGIKLVRSAFPFHTLLLQPYRMPNIEDN